MCIRDSFVHRGAQSSGLSPRGEKHSLKASDAWKCHPQTVHDGCTSERSWTLPPRRVPKT
eukprot:6426819-Lingulodinium_polyedra.AAC.1